MLLSAELRWFWQGDCPSAIERWFFDGAKFPSRPEARLDRYLPQKGRRDIGIKARGTKEEAEIKALIATVADPSLGPVAPSFEIWGKWDATLAIDRAIEVRKRRFLRVFDAVGAEIPATTPLSRQACRVELTELHLTELHLTGPDAIGATKNWWTLGFEAVGALSQVGENLRIAVQRLCREGFSAAGGDFMAYPAWLDRIAGGP